MTKRSRRSFLRYLGAAMFGTQTTSLPFAATADSKPALTFKEVRRGVDITHHLPEGYRSDVVIRWGDNLASGLPAWVPGTVDPVNDALRFGYNNDFVAYFPLRSGHLGSRTGLLCVNHEYVSPRMMWPTATVGPTRSRTMAELMAMGHSVVEVESSPHGWRYIAGAYNRRTTGLTPIELRGPAAGSKRLQNAFHPAGRSTLGVLGACGGGKTPWGTVLVAEENFNFYFTGASEDAREATNQARYGIGRASAYAHWAQFLPRFRADLHPNVANGYGWICEIDPYNPARVPVKRTALGRFKHEAANCVLSADQRAVVYSGDDGSFEYIYRFISREPFLANNPAHNRDLLDAGTLAVARFEADGKLRWVDLVHGQGPLTAANGFHDQADVLVETRRAADLLGATRMDRPEEIETDPRTGSVYVMLTNNPRRTKNSIDDANPRAANRFGHILRLHPPQLVSGAVDHGADSFSWELVLLAGDPANPDHGADYPVAVTEDGWFAAPDNCAFDPQGHLWIATDQGRHWDLTGSADGLFACDFSTPSGSLKRFFRAPIGAEVCGPEFTPDGRTLFLAIQHPGVDGVDDASFSKPGTRWPDFGDNSPPRPSVIAISRDDGAIIGS